MSFGIKQIENILSSHGMPLENLNKCAEELCGRHKADIDSIKEERDNYKTDAETLESVKKELADAKKALEKAEKDRDEYKEQAETANGKYKKLETENAEREVRAKKEKAFSEWLKTEGYVSKGVSKITKYGGFIDKLELDDDGAIKDADKLSKAVAEEWSEYKGKEVTEGTTVATPPAGKAEATPKQSRAAELAAQYHAAHYGGETPTKGE